MNAEKLSLHPTLSLISTAVTAPFSIVALALVSFPQTRQRLLTAIEHLTSPPRPVPTFDLPWPPPETAKLIYTCLKDIGTSKRFAKLIVLLGHGSDSVNNPLYSSYNCGACQVRSLGHLYQPRAHLHCSQGQHGDRNARLFARAANNAIVRSILTTEFGLEIPSDTHFIAGGVNTCSSALFFHDAHEVPETHTEQLALARQSLHYANGEQCVARCGHFFLEKHDVSHEEAFKILDSRASNLAEIRPELCHSTNGGVVVGRRSLTAGINLDGRAFLLSYDPFEDDAQGTSLQRILTPALVVCSGINLEYLFSSSHEGHGSGTKVLTATTHLQCEITRI